MRRLGAAVVALIALAGPVPAAATAGCAPVIEDPTGVLAASSRLAGAVAALGRLGVGVTIAADAQGSVLSTASCSSSESGSAGMVTVDLHGQPPTASVQGSGSVSEQLAQQAQREIRGRLHLTPADTASAVAHGLELVWQEQDQRRQDTSAPREEPAEVADAATEAVRALPSAAAVHVIRRLLLMVAAGVAAAAVVVGAARLVARRGNLRNLRALAQARRGDLAERYVDLDARIATIVTALDHDAAALEPTAAAAALRLGAARTAAVEAAAMRAGAELLALPADLQHASRVQAADVADRCGQALADLEESVVQLSRTGD